MVESAEKEARRALARLKRAMEKSQKELDALSGAIQHAEGDDFPSDAYEGVRDKMDEIRDFAEEEGMRLEEKLLQAGGLEPGRVRRS